MIGHARVFRYQNPPGCPAKPPLLEAESEAVILRCEVLGAGMFIAWHGLDTVFYLLKRGRSLPDTLHDIREKLPGNLFALLAEPVTRHGLEQWLEFKCSEVAVIGERPFQSKPLHDGERKMIHQSWSAR